MDWSIVGKALTLHAHWRSGIYPRRTAGSGELGLGQTAEDIAQTVILQMLSGQRRWDPEKGPLLPWLKRQVDSVMDHLFKSHGYRRETHLEVKNDRGEIVAETQAVQAYGYNTALVSQAPNPEPVVVDAALENDWVAAVKAAVDSLFAAVSDDRELAVIMDVILDGCEPKPRVLAIRLNLTVTEINNRLKRLRRRALSLKLERH